MTDARIYFTGMLLLTGSALAAGEQQQANREAVAQSGGLIAFWDFHQSGDNRWSSRHDPAVEERSYPLSLQRIGDDRLYHPGTWPYQDDDSKLIYDNSGPFGSAPRFNKGYIYGAVERRSFDGTLLDLHGKRPFTMIAWVKFIGQRHMVAGIWDEGGWDRYAGRRQAALFAGLFGRKGTVAHISATGAASYPQSTVSGSQYARARAIDGAAFENNEWVAMAMTWDPGREEVTAYLNGVMTPLVMTDPVDQDVYQHPAKQPANPFRFPHALYSPRSFVVKYNGYNLATNGVSEHRLRVDLAERKLTYEQDLPTAGSAPAGRIFFDVHRAGRSILERPMEMKAIHGQQREIPAAISILVNDEVVTRLEMLQDQTWTQVGTAVKRQIQEGAPFTFGRALGLGAEELGHGSQLYLDGVAVFNRVLSAEELMRLSFHRNSATQAVSRLPPGSWKLAFQDEFTGSDQSLDENWDFQNGPSGHILSSRWRANVAVAEGLVKLLAKKEERAGQSWTAASMWTKRKFKYGYFECRYRYAKATGTNNSFWLMTSGMPKDAPGKFEIDINEGHYPDEINMNIHNWSGEHWAKSKHLKVPGSDLAEEFHVYGLEWNQEELIWYFDGREIRREPNTICHGEAPVLLSLAIIKWAGAVTDAIDGTSMDVDYVRVYQK